MGSEKTFSVQACVTVAALVVLWTAPLSSGCLPQPAETYQLNDSHPDYYLGPVSESRHGVRVNVVTATPSCIWLLNGSQPSADQPYVYLNSSSILLQPFEQNLSTTTITCISRTNPLRRYTFDIGDVCGKFLDVIVITIHQSVHYLCGVHFDE